MSKEKEIIIKKYPNRRLYDTTTSRYITIDDLSEMVKKDHDFKVVDVKTGDDLTRVTLTQIILDHEQKGYNVLPIELIRQIIKFCDNPLSKSFTDYLIYSLNQYNENISNIENLMKSFVSLDSKDWTKQFEKINQQNMAFFKSILSGGVDGSSKKPKE